MRKYLFIYAFGICLALAMAIADRVYAEENFLPEWLNPDVRTQFAHEGCVYPLFYQINRGSRHMNLDDNIADFSWQIMEVFEYHSLVHEDTTCYMILLDEPSHQQAELLLGDDGAGLIFFGSARPQTLEEFSTELLESGWEHTSLFRGHNEMLMGDL